MLVVVEYPAVWLDRGYRADMSSTRVCRPGLLTDGW
jgi:hypothetical protein